MAASQGLAQQAQRAVPRAQHPAQTTRSREMTMLWMPSSPTLTSELEGAFGPAPQAAACPAECKFRQHKQQQPQEVDVVLSSMTRPA